MKEYDRLKENEDKIIAAAAAGLSVDRNGNPIPHNTYEQMAYDRAYELLFGNGGKNNGNDTENGNLIPLLHAEDGMKNSGETGSPAGQNVDFSKSTYMSYYPSDGLDPQSWQRAIRDDAFENGGYTYIDENGLFRSVKTPGVKSNDDYYVVAMGNGFRLKAQEFDSTFPTDGTINAGYTCQVKLKDSTGKEYTIDVLVGETKGAANALLPHDHPVEFIVNGTPNSKVCSGGNVDYTKLLNANGVTEITDIALYEDGARYTGSYTGANGDWHHT